MMGKIIIYPTECTPASHAAASHLSKHGLTITDHITPEATHLLMDIPSFSGDGILRSGARLDELLAMLPKGITLIGGNLPEGLENPKIDLLRDEAYQYENAALTAECALRVAAEKMNFALRGVPVLVIGWGRIGKHLAHLLQAFGARVYILSRSEAHQAEAASFGLCPIDPEDTAKNFRLLFNTAPGMVLPKKSAEILKNCLKIDLASLPGMAGEDVIPARGLPGIRVPESSGKLIGETVLRLLGENEK